jgi:hypothetical protein
MLSLIGSNTNPNISILMSKSKIATGSIGIRCGKRMWWAPDFADIIAVIEFLSVFAKERTIFFKHHSIEDTSIFLQKTEDLLEVTSLTPEDGLFFYQVTECFPTKVKDIILIRPSDFWLSSRIKQSFFCSLLSSIQLYSRDSDNYEESIKNNQHFKNTYPAVVRFLMGFTELDEEIEQAKQVWHILFQGFDRDKAKSLLRRPFTSNLDYGMIGI